MDFPEWIILIVAIFAAAAILLSLMWMGATNCSDGLVYLNTDTFKGCVPYEHIKENA